MTDRDDTPPAPDVQTLLLHVRALLRHAVSAASSRGDEAAPVRFGPVEIDLERRVVRRHGIPVALTPREYSLLAALAERFGAPVDRAELLRVVWGAAPGESAAKYRTIDQHICRLRRKLEPLPSHPRYIVTVLGIGYRLAEVESGST